MKKFMTFIVVLTVTGAALLFAAHWYLDSHGVTTRRLAAYVEQRQQGHDGAIAAIGNLIQAGLRGTEKAQLAAPDFGAWPVGAPAAPRGAAAATKTVADIDQLRADMAQAAPGDVIVLLPGDYRIDGASLAANRAGRADASITVRGSAGVYFEANVAEAIVVTAPFWRFEGLQLKGVCAQMGDCEHAFHVVGQGHHFAAVGNTLSDFNAHFKINGSDGSFPDNGLIEYNTLVNHAIRRTDNPVTPVDLVAANNWIIRANLISDFIKGGGDQVSYGAFAKGGGSGTLFEKNVVWCEHLLRDQPGYRVGLSFGGGGSGAQYCRDGKCIVEHSEGIMRANLVAACSDDGIYLNNAAQSKVIDNWVVGTAGISARFAGSSADIEGNLVDGPIRSRDGALIRERENRGGAAAPVWTAAPALRR